MTKKEMDDAVEKIKNIQKPVISQDIKTKIDNFTESIKDNIPSAISKLNEYIKNRK